MSYCNKTVQFDPYTFWLLTGKEKEKAKQYCPVDSGALRDSIYWYETNGQIVIGAGVFYAAFVEYGTSRNRAQPFLRPAINYYVNTGFTDSAIMESIENHLGL
jgi:HK97 gp10 family phage protein